jgi:hypothetical protein
MPIYRITRIGLARAADVYLDDMLAWPMIRRQRWGDCRRSSSTASIFTLSVRGPVTCHRIDSLKRPVGDAAARLAVVKFGLQLREATAGCGELPF